MVFLALAGGLVMLGLLGLSEVARAVSGAPPAGGTETGAASFVLKREIQIPTHPRALAIGDFNRDGNKDLAVLNDRRNRVSILLGRGDGTFGPRRAHCVPANANAIAVVDLNGGGKQDLVIRSAGAWTRQGTPGRVSVLLGRGDGTFRAGGTYGVGYVEDVSASPVLATADLNGDDKPDVVTAEGRMLVVLLGRGDGTLARARTSPIDRFTGGWPVALALGRLNGDRRPDAVVCRYWGANEPTGDLGVMLGVGKGGFGRARIEDTNFMLPFGVALVDLNHDGTRDRIVTWQRMADLESLPPEYPAVSVSLGRGDGTFAAAADYDLGTADVWAFQLADFNGDGERDLLLAFMRGVRLLLGNPDGTFQAAGQVDAIRRTHGAWVAAADFTNDGQPDFVVEGANARHLDFYLNASGVAR